MQHRAEMGQRRGRMRARMPGSLARMPRLQDRTQVHRAQVRHAAGVTEIGAQEPALCFDLSGEAVRPAYKSGFDKIVSQVQQ